MRITIEPTTEPADHFECMQHTVVVEHPKDGLKLSIVVELFSSALLAYGYDKQTVDEVINCK